MSNASSKQLQHNADNSQPVPWGSGAAIFLLVLIFASQIAVIGAFYELLLRLGVTTHWMDGNAASFIAYGLTSVVSAFILWLFLNYYKADLKHLGFLRPVKWRDLRLVLLGAVAYLILSVALATIAGLLFPSLDLDQEQLTGFTPTEHIVELALVFLSLVVLPPLVEEAVFRGFVFSGLRTKLPFFAAAFLSAALFGLAHFQLNVAIDTAALGLVLAWLYERTGSLWPAIILHAIKNLTAFALIFVFGV